MYKKEIKKTIKRSIDWKKLAIYTAAGVALVGAGAAFVIKLKNGTCNTMDLSAFCDGVGWDAKLLWDKEGMNVTQMAVEKMSVRDVTKMLDVVNPDVYSISMDTKWDEIIFIQH